MALKADLELGGTDQIFNLLVGRELQKQYGQPQQVVMTMPLLEGLDGWRKMSKTLDNHIGIAEAPGEMFGKIMSISDLLMWRYYQLLSFKSADQIADLEKEVKDGMNPRDAKFALAEEIVARFHSIADATRAREGFIDQFREGAMPPDIPVYEFPAGDGWPIATSVEAGEFGKIDFGGLSHDQTRRGARGRRENQRPRADSESWRVSYLPGRQEKVRQNYAFRRQWGIISG